MKMNLNRVAAAVVIVAHLSAIPAPAWAIGSGSVVYDPANHVENIISALQAIRSNILSEAQLAQEVISAVNTGKQYVQMLKDYQTTVKSMRGMSAGQIFQLAKSMGGEVAVYADLADRLGRTDRNLRGVLDAYRDIERMGNFSNMSPQQIFWTERSRRQNEQSYARDRFTNIQRMLGSVNQDIQKIDQLRWSIPDTSMEGEQSMRAALENVSMHLNLMAGQNTQLLALFAEDSAAKSAKTVSERTLSEASEYNDYAKQYGEEWRIRQRYQQAMDRARSAWQSIPGGP